MHFYYTSLLITNLVFPRSLSYNKFHHADTIYNMSLDVIILFFPGLLGFNPCTVISGGTTSFLKGRPCKESAPTLHSGSHTVLDISQILLRQVYIATASPRSFPLPPASSYHHCFPLLSPAPQCCHILSSSFPRGKKKISFTSSSLIPPYSSFILLTFKFLP